MGQDTKSIYRPRQPELTDLHLVVSENLELFCDTYDDGSVKVTVGDYGRLRRLVRYLARPAVSAERVTCDRSSGTVTVRRLIRLGFEVDPLRPSSRSSPRPRTRWSAASSITLV